MTTSNVELLHALEQLKKKIAVENLYWTDTAVNFAGYSFSNCRFDNCTIVNSHLGEIGSNCRLDNCTFTYPELDGENET